MTPKESNIYYKPIYQLKINDPGGGRTITYSIIQSNRYLGSNSTLNSLSSL